MPLSKLSVLILINFLATKCAANIVDELTQRLSYVTNECFDAQNVKQPAYKCSGIIFRGIHLNKGQRFAWSLKPSDKKINSFAFGFLRRDHPFSWVGSGYDAGFIIYPHLKTPSHKTTQKVLCTYPIDGATDYRNDRGCGKRSNDTTGLSQQCDAQNITSFPKWVEYFKFLNTGNMVEFIMSHCGFDASKKTTAVDNFALTLQANSYLQNVQDVQHGTRYAYVSSEFRVEGWDENNAKTIPIEAFFYFINTANGYEHAVKYRDEFYAQTGENMPIVGIHLPSDTDSNIYVKEGKQG
ncbi:uncharacterized protein LOC129568091 [Sitodiplosis mosellana]|uniref:uncharacterized protein LOC129568091 n=1 Tax=Sitodiplosis mosellana TaxID=263140 RepID=UPI002444E70A|nr:uncharacterized protein LOC129568091 [Sitodiplosis mosellana]